MVLDWTTLELVQLSVDAIGVHSLGLNAHCEFSVDRPLMLPVKGITTPEEVEVIRAHVWTLITWNFTERKWWHWHENDMTIFSYLSKKCLLQQYLLCTPQVSSLHWLWLTDVTEISSALQSCQPITERSKVWKFDMPEYHTHAMRRAMFDKFGLVTVNYRDLTGDRATISEK